MKIQENSERGGKERLGEQENKANRALRRQNEAQRCPGRREENPKGARLSLAGEQVS